MPDDMSLALCSICEQAADKNSPLYRYTAELERIGRAPGWSHHQCLQRAKNEFEARRRADAAE